MGKSTSSLRLILFLALGSILIFGSSSNQAWAANTAPTVDAGSDPAAFNQGGTFSSTGSFTDPDDDTWTGTVNWGDGTPEEALALVGKTFSLSHTYNQDIFTLNDGSPFEVIVTINDETDDSTDSVLVTVNNVSPTIASIAGGTIDQGDLFATMGSFTDPDADIWTAYVNFEGTLPSDQDSDGDGINDADEGIPSDIFPTCLETDSQVRDTDSDGLTDGEEVFIFSTDPCTPTGTVVTPDDSDGDGINNVDEDTGTSLPQYPLCETDSQNRDTDNDGLTDGEEVLIFGTNPCDDDTDDDGTNDADETKLGIDDENVVLEPDKTFELEHTFLKSGVFTSVFSINDGPFDPIEEEFIVWYGCCSSTRRS